MAAVGEPLTLARGWVLQFENMWSQDTPKKKWSEEKTMKFVLAYRFNDCLWDINHKDYKNRRIREMVCCQMAEKFDCSPDDVRRKIKSLRGAYCHERNKIKDSLESGYDVDSVYVPSVVWYDEMDAVMNGVTNEVENTLINHHTILEQSDPEQQNDDGDDDDIVYEVNDNELFNKKDSCSNSNNDNFSDDEQVSEISHFEPLTKVIEGVSSSLDKSIKTDTSLRKVSTNSLAIVRKKKKDSTKHVLNAIDQLRNVSTGLGVPVEPSQESEFDIFGRSVAQQLKNFKDIKTALRLQHKIQGILCEERIQEIDNLQHENSNSNNKHSKSVSEIVFRSDSSSTVEHESSGLVAPA